MRNTIAALRARIIRLLRPVAQVWNADTDDAAEYAAKPAVEPAICLVSVFCMGIVELCLTVLCWSRSFELLSGSSFDKMGSRCWQARRAVGREG